MSPENNFNYSVFPPNLNKKGVMKRMGGNIENRKSSEKNIEVVVQQIANLLKQITLNGKTLIVLDECDHLAQQEYFQNAIQTLLKECPNISFLLNTHQPVHHSTSSNSVSSMSNNNSFVNAFKNVHYKLKPLAPEDAGKLFLRRVSQSITWYDIGYGSNTTGIGATNSVIKIAGNPNVYQQVGDSPLVKSLEGHPRKIIEAAAKF